MQSYIRYTPSNNGTGELIAGDASLGKHGRHGQLAYTFEDLPLGTILLAATASGVCWLGIHASAAYLEAELRGDFPAAEIRPDAEALRETAGRVRAWISGAARELYLPLDLRGTPFQLAVWRELCAIPYGTTRSYGEIARRLGRPSASRAVGHANGSNPLAIVIPCHRAIGADGRLTGYRWGLEYKRRLLEHERALAPGA